MEISSHLAIRLQYQHKALVDMIDDLSIEKIKIKPIADKWSINENIVHLQCYQQYFIKRIDEIMETDNPTFERYHAADDPLFAQNCTRVVHEVMHDFFSVRKNLAARLMSFSREQLQRKGTHPYFGTLNISEWINFFLLHESHHLYTIFRLKAEIVHQPKKEK
ncbi:MAG TPA: DinB family protein [Chitinophagaceae bacterium]|nr:DinB family protein [Chitinophagaceae bacterium]